MNESQHFESSLLLDISEFLVTRTFYMCKIDRIYEEFLSFCASNKCEHNSSLKKENFEALLESRTFSHLIISEAQNAFERVYTSTEKIDPVCAIEAYLLMRESRFYDDLSNEELASLIRSSIKESKNLMIYEETSDLLRSPLHVKAVFTHHRLAIDVYMSEIMLRKLNKL